MDEADSVMISNDGLTDYVSLDWHLGIKSTLDHARQLPRTTSFIVINTFLQCLLKPGTLHELFVLLHVVQTILATPPWSGVWVLTLWLHRLLQLV